jgi:hypothetical protein
LPNPQHPTISNLELEILEGGDHEILENPEKNKDKPVITKTRKQELQEDTPITSPHNSDRINPVAVHKRNNIIPTYQPNFRLSPRQVDWLTAEVKRLEREKKIVKTNSPFNSPLNLVAKDNTWRFTVNYKLVNNQIENDSFPLPLIIPRLKQLTKYKYFCKVDLSNGFWNIPITPESYSFEIPGLGQYTWKVLPQGLIISPSAFQNRMESILAPLSPLDIHPYMNDMIYGADNIKELDQKTFKLLKLLEHHKMKINKDKCVFNVMTIEALGFEISQGSIKPKESYLNKLSETPTPTNVQRLRKIIGKFNHVREHFPGSEKSLRILYPLLQKTSRFRWTTQHAEAFEHLKWLLDTPQETTDFDRGKELTMISNAGEDGFAVQLKQGTKLIATIARNYNSKSIGLLSPPIREAHAIKESLLALRTQIIGSHVHCLTDSLVAVQLSRKNIDKGGKLLHRISAELDQFDLSFEHVPRSDPRIKIVDELGRDNDPRKEQSPKKARCLVDHESNGYYFRTMINNVDIDCMIDSGAALSMMRRSMAEDMRLNIVMLDEPRLFFGSHPFECRSYAIAELYLGPDDETISVKFYLVDRNEMFGPDTDDCILGQDFLHEYATEWDFNNRTICLAHNNQNYLVHVDDSERRTISYKVLNRADILTTLTLPGIEEKQSSLQEM